MTNPLLLFADNPHYHSINAEHVLPAIEATLATNREQYKTLLEQPAYSWDNLIEPIQVCKNNLSKVWQPVAHLNAVMNTEAIRNAYNVCLPLLTEYETEVSQNRAFYDAILVIQETDDSLKETQKQVLSNQIKQFQLSGVGLEDDLQEDSRGMIAPRDPP